jgi:hypothetical protein
VHHGGGDRAVEGDDRAVVQALEHVVQAEDVRPIGVFGADGSAVCRGDRRLDLVGPWLAARESGGQQRDAFVDGAAIPAAAVLVGQRYQLTGRPGARGPACVGEEQQGDQAGGFGVVGAGTVERPGEPDGLGRQVGALQGGTGSRRMPDLLG